MEDKLSFLGADLVALILSSLPPKSLLMFKCTCKRWYRFTSDPTFQHIYTRRSMNSSFPPGFFAQEAFDCCDNIAPVAISYVSTNREFVSENILDFLPVKTALVGSSNGILCCRNLDTSLCKIHDLRRRENSILMPRSPLVFYICNPATREWISLKMPLGYKLGKAFAFDYDPDGPSFTIVGIQLSEDKPDWGSFVTYNSKSKMWRVSREFHCFASKIYPQKKAILNGQCYWLANNLYETEGPEMDSVYHLVAYDIGTESCQVIDLPSGCIKGCITRSCCLGISEGHIHYICAYQYEVKIWLLKSTMQWVPADFRFPPVFEFLNEHWLLSNNVLQGCVWRNLGSEPNTLSKFLAPMFLYNGVLFLRAPVVTGAYNIRSGEHAFNFGFLCPPCRDPAFLLYWPTIYLLKNLEDPVLRGCSSRNRKKSVPKRSHLF